MHLLTSRNVEKGTGRKEGRKEGREAGRERDQGRKEDRQAEEKGRVLRIGSGVTSFLFCFGPCLSDAGTLVASSRPCRPLLIAHVFLFLLQPPIQTGHSNGSLERLLFLFYVVVLFLVSLLVLLVSLLSSLSLVLGLLILFSIFIHRIKKLILFLKV